MNIQRLNAYFECCDKLRKRKNYLAQIGESIVNIDKMIEVVELHLIANIEKEVLESEEESHEH